MPATAKSKRKYKRLTDRQILRRIDAGTLIVSVFDDHQRIHQPF